MPSDSDSQVPIFLERLRSIFRRSPSSGGREEDPQQGTAIAVCVLASLVLWLSLTLQEGRMVTIEFPVEVLQIDEDQALAERPPETVRVQLEGTGMDLLRLAFNPTAVEVAAGDGSVDVEEALNLPRANDARIVGVSPSTFELDIEPRVQRRVPVRSRLDIRPSSAYELIEPPILRPDSITISGAGSVVSSLTGWPTESAVFEAVRDTVERTVALQDSLSGLVVRSTDEVRVIVRSGKFAEETREVKVEVTGVPTGQDLVALQPSTIRIRYRVLFDQLFASRRSSEFFATVSYSQIRSDTTGFVEPRIHVPSDLVIRDPEPIPARLQYYTFLSDE